MIRDIIRNHDQMAEALPADFEHSELSPGSKKLFYQLLDENERLRTILDQSDDTKSFIQQIEEWVNEYFQARPEAYQFCMHERQGRDAYITLDWQDLAAIRLYDYIQNHNNKYEDLNLRGKEVVNQPFYLLWLAHKKKSGALSPHFLIDMIQLFRQFNGSLKQNKPDKAQVKEWMDKHPSGLDPRIVKLRKDNKKRILNVFIDKIESGKIKDKRFYFTEEKTREEKFETALKWWDNRLFHLRFAVRDPELLNELLGGSFDEATMKVLREAKEAGIPFFVNPYYLSLLNVNAPIFARNADMAIRDYIIYSKQLIDEYGHIVAWEKEDIVEPGKPNAAGWMLPSEHNIHRRYPEVAILIPDTVGRACGGLCVSCQRMYDFQNGHLNFNLEKLGPRETWPQKLKRLMKYFEEDSQLRDILITGGDALMSSDKSLERILNEVYKIAKNKIRQNKDRMEGKKYAEMLRVRLGTRLPVYLPQRITAELIQVLANFKKKASAIGMKQFVIQTHFESAMEVTPEAKRGLEMLHAAGWIVTNQQVFTAAASRRGHTAKLRQVLNEVGVLPYYTFSVKGYMENSHNFATNERAVQEQLEEKIIGNVPKEYYSSIKNLSLDAEKLVENIASLKDTADIPFMATDRNVLNLPGVGKSLTFRTIGITHDGRRILEFDHDATRRHSPIIHKMGKVTIIESKSISAYLKQLEEMGEDMDDYINIFGYSVGETEERMPIYEYPEYDYKLTKQVTNLEID